MMKITFPKELKDKKIIHFYETINENLNFIHNLKTKESIEKHHLDLLAFKNGFTDKSKLFKNLRKAFIFNKGINIDLLINYNKSRLYYLQNPKLKRMDDLLVYAYEQSILSFFILLSDDKIIENITLVKEIAIFDKLSYIILNIEPLRLDNEVWLPNQLIEDYGIEYTIDQKIMINESFLFLIDYLVKKIKNSYDVIELNMSLLNESLGLILKNITNQRLIELNKYLISIHKK